MRIEALMKAAFFGVSVMLFFGVSACVHAEEDPVLAEMLSMGEGEVSTMGGDGLSEETLPTEEESEGMVNDMVEETVTTEFSITPVVANEKAKPRDIIKKELIVTNNTAQRKNLYITVENIDPTKGTQEFKGPSSSDLSTSLANWVEITRGVIELDSFESRKIPYLIHVNLSAKPGSYHARIQFRTGPHRAAAESNPEGSELMLNLEVEDDANERLQLGNFMSEDGVVLGSSVSFSYLLENIGNRDIEPRGSIRIFNRRGEEVGSVPLNANGEEISPSNKKQLASAWSSSGRFGRYKAFLDLEYGENQLASVQDTVYFWVFPWKEILAALVGVILLGVVGTYIVHMRSIAQPVPVRSRQQPTHEEHIAIEQAQNAYNPTQRMHQVQNAQTHVTVLGANDNQAMPPKDRNQPQKQGATVELSPRGAQSGPKTQGNVVQLQSRRS